MSDHEQAKPWIEAAMRLLIAAAISALMLCAWSAEGREQKMYLQAYRTKQAWEKFFNVRTEKESIVSADPRAKRWVSLIEREQKAGQQLRKELRRLDAELELLYGSAPE